MRQYRVIGLFAALFVVALSIGVWLKLQLWNECREVNSRFYCYHLVFMRN